MGSLGSQTVTIVHAAPSGSPDALGDYPMTLTRTAVAGCVHEPISARGGGGSGPALAEQATEAGVTVATDWFLTTAPPHPALLAATSADTLEVDGQVFQIIGGIKRFTNFAGQLEHVSILSERQEIG